MLNENKFLFCQFVNEYQSRKSFNVVAFFRVVGLLHASRDFRLHTLV